MSNDLTLIMGQDLTSMANEAVELLLDVYVGDVSVFR